jgi:hypothetical protein
MHQSQHHARQVRQYPVAPVAPVALRGGKRSACVSKSRMTEKEATKHAFFF